jgi:hypothetical protein
MRVILPRSRGEIEPFRAERLARLEPTARPNFAILGVERFLP